MAAAVIYGVIHDEITAHLCVQYFSVAHPLLFHTQSPALLALCWGVAATIGIGAMLGLLLAEVSQSPGRVPWPVKRVARSVSILLGAMAAGAVAAGSLGYVLAEKKLIFLPQSLAEEIPYYLHSRFMAVWFGHSASYLVGLGGAAFLIFRIWRERGKPRIIQLLPRTRGGLARAALVVTVSAIIIWLRITRSGN